MMFVVFLIMFVMLMAVDNIYFIVLKTVAMFVSFYKYFLLREFVYIFRLYIYYYYNFKFFTLHIIKSYIFILFDR